MIEARRFLAEGNDKKIKFVRIRMTSCRDRRRPTETAAADNVRPLKVSQRNHTALRGLRRTAVVSTLRHQNIRCVMKLPSPLPPRSLRRS